MGGNSICELYEIDYNVLLEAVRGVKKILLTAPDGLKKLYDCIREYFLSKKLFVELYFSSSPSYGSCYISMGELELIKPDIIVHIGHNEYPLISTNIGKKILYIPAFYKRAPQLEELEEMYQTILRKNFKRIGLIASIQHTKILGKIGEFLESRGIRTYIGKSAYNQMFPGQVLGCEYSALISIIDKIDAVLTVSGGRFHALGAYLVSRKPIIIYDPYSGKVIDFTKDAVKIYAKRLYLVEHVRNNNYRRVGLIVGVSPGQYRDRLVKYLYRLSKEKGFEPYLIVSDYVNEDRLASIDNAFNLDFYVVTSCPRIPIDDIASFYKPVLTPGEYLMILNNIRQYVFPW